MVTAPLTTRCAEDAVAIVLRPLDALSGFTGIVTAKDFLSHVRCLATVLPEQKYAINLCENRYLFMVVFCATIVRGQVNLLPPNKKSITLYSLADCYQDCYLVHDGAGMENLPTIDLTPAIDLTKVSLTKIHHGFKVPEIPLNHLAAISFTSGSTGDSKPNYKSWRVIVESSRNNAIYMLAGFDHTTLFQLATVPPQHMWGLETSVLLPMFEAICVADAKPLFPADIGDALDKLPAPRMMVTAPVHLRALYSSRLHFPALKLILCATSPLSPILARQAEELFSAELREVYGCSEIGSMAIRRTVSDSPWTLFSGITLDVQDEVKAATDYLPDPVVLQDKLQMLDSCHFQLQGRASDMVDIAGKRGSLLEINKVLMDFPGIVDGIIFLPDSAPGIGRLAALVVLAENTELTLLKNHLRQHLDNAFIPRPLLQIDKLPREENGKLPKQRLHQFYRKLVGQKG